MNFWALFWWLLVSHAICDFSLQIDTMAKGKNRHTAAIILLPPGQKFVPCWQYWLSAHALIHGGGVSLVTGSVFWRVFAAIVHWITDFLKCDNWTNPHTDQLIHGLTILIIAWGMS